MSSSSRLKRKRSSSSESDTFDFEPVRAVLVPITERVEFKAFLALLSLTPECYLALEIDDRVDIMDMFCCAYHDHLDLNEYLQQAKV